MWRIVKKRGRCPPPIVRLATALCLVYACFLFWWATVNYRDINIWNSSPAGAARTPEILVGVKTTGKNHRKRLPLLLKTWFSSAESPADVFFFTDTYDSLLSQQLSGQFIVTPCGDTHKKADLCCKTGHALETLTKALLRVSWKRGSKWICIVDDDVFVNWAVLRQVLLEEFSFKGKKPIYLGKRSPRRQPYLPKNHSRYFPGTKVRRHWFGTGGAGVCLNRPAAVQLKKALPMLAGRGSEAGRSTSSSSDGIAALLQRVCTDFLSLPDDVCLGLIMEVHLGVKLQISDKFHSHLENLTEIINPLQEATLSFNGHNTINLKFLNMSKPIQGDRSHLLSFHCALFPKTEWCPR